MHPSSLVALIALLLVATSYAQVYLGSSGNEWGGSCDNSCPQSAPCQLSISGATTMSGSCVLFLESGLAIPSHFLYMDVGGNITLSSLGTVSLAGPLNVESRGGGIVLQDLTLNAAFMIMLTSPEAFIFDSSVAFTGAAQISFIGAGTSSVVVHHSNFTSAAPLIRLDLAPNANVTISEVNAELSQGISLTLSTTGNEPNVHIRDSHITGLEFQGAPLKDVTLENVVGTLSTTTTIFEQTPVGTIAIWDSTLTSTMNSWLASLSGQAHALNITRSQFDNVAVRGPMSYVKFENSTFTLGELYDSVVNIKTVSGAILTNCSFNSRTATGSASALITFEPGYGLGLTMSDIVYSSPSTIPRLGLSGMVQLEANAVFPSLYLAGSTYFYGTYTHEFSGDIAGSSGGLTLGIAGNALVIFNSISILNGLSISAQSGATPEFAYRVTDPDHGIQCTNGGSCINQPNTLTRIIWDLPLPAPRVSYPYINTWTTVATFVSDSPEYTLSSSNSNSISYFSFDEVPCPAFCNPEYSGNCTSTAQCTCKAGYEGNCQYPPVEMIPISITPPDMSTPSGNTPSPTGNSPSAPSSNPPSESPNTSPGSVPTTQPSATPASNSPSSPTSSATPRQMTVWCIPLALIAILLFDF